MLGGCFGFFGGGAIVVAWDADRPLCCFFVLSGVCARGMIAFQVIRTPPTLLRTKIFGISVGPSA